MTEQALVQKSIKPEKSYLHKLLLFREFLQHFAALEQHIKRAVFQGGQVWGQALVADPVVLLPTSWGWIRTSDGLYEPHWTTLEEASKTWISCGCKKDLVPAASAKKAGLECTALCKCEGVSNELNTIIIFLSTLATAMRDGSHFDKYQCCYLKGVWPFLEHLQQVDNLFIWVKLSQILSLHAILS